MENKIPNNSFQQLNFSAKFLIKYFRIKSIVPILIGLSFFYLIFYTSCANIGSPTGGPKDSIPPVVIKTIPELRETNYKGTDVRLTFDEYIVPDEIREKLVISPPMKKKPVIKMKGKTLIVEFPQELRKSATYSLDFKDAVADNNEKNPIEDLRFSFSTGETYDSLKVSGFVKNALNQEPVENAIVMLHHQKEYTAFVDSLPDYIGTTNQEGFFLIDNIAEGAYRLYAIVDADNSLTYNSKSEKIAFADSLIIPSAKFVNRNDTVVKGMDTLLITGYTDYLPEPQNLMLFEEEYFDQYLDASKRNQNNKCEFFFSESLSDSFQVNLLKPLPTGNWNFIESNLKRDSIIVWLTDTIISNSDSLKFELRYEVLDSLNQLVVKRDTLELLYANKNKTKVKRKKDEKIELPTITLGTNINNSAHNIYQRIQIEAPEPLLSFDLNQVRLFSLDDTIKTPIPIAVEKDSNSIRKYYVEHLWKADSRYIFEIDSAAARNIYGYPNKKIDEKFKTQKEEYYAKIFLTISGLEGPAIVQLLANNKDEKVLQKIQILEDGMIQFPYLKPDKYKIRLILDSNKNGKWDTGFLANGLQPEAVVYYPKIIKVKSNFEYKESWEIKYDSGTIKELIDEDLEKEKARKKEQSRKTEN